jgi:DNA-binding NarL/FixJ family response regulator
VHVALADDSALFRGGLAALLEVAGMAVDISVGSGWELEEALRQAPGAPRVDVAVLDIRMPPTFTDEGLVTAEALRRSYPGLGVLVLSTYVEAAYAVRLLQHGSGGVGYLLKDRVEDVDVLVSALRRVSAGGSVVDPDVVARIVRRPAPDPVQTLTPRENDVLSLVAEGWSNASIAAQLRLSEKTVEGHVASSFVKLGLLAQPDRNRRVLAVLRYLHREQPSDF